MRSACLPDASPHPLQRQHLFNVYVHTQPNFTGPALIINLCFNRMNSSFKTVIWDSSCSWSRAWDELPCALNMLSTPVCAFNMGGLLHKLTFRVHT